MFGDVFCRDPFILFSGGLPYDKANSTPSITIMQGKTTTVLEMEHTVIDFLCLCDNPWPSSKFVDCILCFT